MADRIRVASPSIGANPPSLSRPLITRAGCGTLKRMDGDPTEGLSPEMQRARRRVAAALSIVPGLGHLFKGHVVMGLLFLLIGAPVVIFISLLLILGTAGLSLVVPVIYWIAVAAHAFAAEDLRAKHRIGV